MVGREVGNGVGDAKREAPRLNEFGWVHVRLEIRDLLDQQDGTSVCLGPLDFFMLLSMAAAHIVLIRES